MTPEREDLSSNPPMNPGEVDPALDDTVADVELGEQLDAIEDEDASDAIETEEGGVGNAEPVWSGSRRGMFGWPVGAEVLVWGVLSLVGLSCGIMTAFMWKYWIGWVIAFVLIGPYSFYRLADIWPRWTRGRPFIEALVDSLGGEHDEQMSTR